MMSHKFLKNSLFYIILIFVFNIALAQQGANLNTQNGNVEISSDHAQLKSEIEKRAQELQGITEQIKENQKNLEETKGQSRTLQREINQIDSNINQVALGIDQSEITIEKLKLEMDSLEYTIIDAERKIGVSQKSLSEILQAIQESESETPLIIFLKNKSLAESFFETQTLNDLNLNLGLEIDRLRNIRGELADQLKEKESKKGQLQIENQNLKYRKIILAETKQDKQSVLTQTKSKEQIYQKSLSELEKKQAEIATEIEKLDEELRLKIDPTLLPTKRPGVLGMPVNGALSQGYGATSFARYGYRGKWHNGADFAAPLGTPVFSAEKGKIISVADQDRYCRKGAYGKYIAIEHENNLTTLYAHLSLQVVKAGDIVERGSLIGYSGKTGYATGPHLHLGVYASQTFRIGPSRSCGPEMPYGGDLNPLDYL